MYLLHRKKNGIYANISLFLSYSEVTVATRSSPYPDQMVDQHLEMTSTEIRTTRWAPETDPQWRPRHLDGHQDKTLVTRWVLCTIWLCCSRTNCWFVWSEENWPPTEPGFSQGFFSRFCHRWSFGSSGLLSRGHLISSDIIDLIAQILLELNWAARCHHWINNEMPLTENWVFNLVILHYWHYFPILILESCFDTICIVKSAI